MKLEDTQRNPSKLNKILIVMRAGIIKKTDETKASPNALIVGPWTYFLPIAFWFYFFRDDLHSDDCKFHSYSHSYLLK